MGISDAGIVLCGGKSRRMGRSKVMLPFGPETMLQRVVRLLDQAVVRVLVHRAGERGEWRVESGESPHFHPSPLAAGRLPLVSAFVTACDAPLLVPALVRRMIELAAGHEIAVPHIEGRDHPLAAVYRSSVLPQVEALLEADRLRPAYLFELVRTRRVTADELTEADPGLGSLINVNSREDYQAILGPAGLADDASRALGTAPGTPEEESS
jgi:molybdopterin-guanine dinucleotide biosynthesis protein A